ncbi:SAM-dependent methyltransferase [Litorivicinus lipolyticus]|nr:cyclopropane-fatty-acyl-phospholipid synthase family protein [Litorivicinus lipolyticus]
MTTSVHKLAPMAQTGSLIERRCRKACFALLNKLEHGLLEIEEGQHIHRFGRDDDPELRVKVHVLDPSAWADLALRGAIGAGEAYMHSVIEVDDLTRLTRVFVRNVEVLDQLDGGLAKLLGSTLRAVHWFNRNNREGARRNIRAHYDLGNDLFEAFLDPTMMYSSGVYPSADAPLETAAVHKLDLICQKLGLQPGMRVIEIGTGWGGMAIHAAKHYGVHVTTTTISDAQYDLAQARVTAEGLDDQITLLKQDYRDLTGTYDRLVSVEMIEAVGHQYLDTFFAKCRSLLKPDGLMLIQAITIVDHRYDQALQGVDFIQKYIFPGGFVPSVSAMMKSVGAVTDLRLVDLQDYAGHYAQTLAHWRQRFDDARDHVDGLGYDERFQRMWRFYLSYCEGGFAERQLGLGQLLLAAPRSSAQSPASPL